MPVLAFCTLFFKVFFLFKTFDLKFVHKIEKSQLFVLFTCFPWTIVCLFFLKFQFEDLATLAGGLLSLS